MLGHNCKERFFLMMHDEDGTDYLGNSFDDKGDNNSFDVVESEDVSVLYSLVGLGSPRSL